MDNALNLWYGNNIKIIIYPGATVDNAILLRWDFSDNKVYNFTVNNTDVFISNNSMLNLTNYEHDIVHIDSYNFIAMGNGTANINVSFNVTSSREKTSTGWKNKEVSPPFPISFNGFFDNSHLWANNLDGFALLSRFPLPQKSLRMNESEIIPIKFTSDDYEKKVVFEGTIEIKYLGAVMIDNNICVHISCHGKLESSETRKLPGKYSLIGKIKGDIYFDINRHCFSRGFVAAISKTSVKSPALDNSSEMINTDSYFRSITSYTLDNIFAPDNNANNNSEMREGGSGAAEEENKIDDNEETMMCIYLDSLVITERLYKIEFNKFGSAEDLKNYSPAVFRGMEKFKYIILFNNISDKTFEIRALPKNNKDLKSFYVDQDGVIRYGYGVKVDKNSAVYKK